MYDIHVSFIDSIIVWFIKIKLNISPFEKTQKREGEGKKVL